MQKRSHARSAGVRRSRPRGTRSRAKCIATRSAGRRRCCDEQGSEAPACHRCRHVRAATIRRALKSAVPAALCLRCGRAFDDEAQRCLYCGRIARFGTLRAVAWYARQLTGRVQRDARVVAGREGVTFWPRVEAAFEIPTIILLVGGLIYALVGVVGVLLWALARAAL